MTLATEVQPAVAARRLHPAARPLLLMGLGGTGLFSFAGFVANTPAAFAQRPIVAILLAALASGTLVVSGWIGMKVFLGNTSVHWLPRTGTPPVGLIFGAAFLTSGCTFIWKLYEASEKLPRELGAQLQALLLPATVTALSWVMLGAEACNLNTQARLYESTNGGPDS